MRTGTRRTAQIVTETKKKAFIDVQVYGTEFAAGEAIFVSCFLQNLARTQVVTRSTCGLSPDSWDLLG